MNLLALDSSTKTFSLAVAQDEKILKKRNVRLKGVLSSSIIPRIDRILKDAGLTLDKIDGFVVGRGPGSFTSLRVGVTTVNALAFAKAKPAVSFCSLDAVALNLPTGPVDQTAVIVDARRGMVYACLYTAKKQRLVRKTPYLLVPIPEFLDRISTDVRFAGDGLGLYEEDIRQWAQRRGKKQTLFAPEKYWAPQAANLILPGLERLRQGRTDNIDKLEPLYLYPKECQVVRS